MVAIAKLVVRGNLDELMRLTWSILQSRQIERKSVNPTPKARERAKSSLQQGGLKEQK
jgi:hypothetical protein